MGRNLQNDQWPKKTVQIKVSFKQNKLRVIVSNITTETIGKANIQILF